MKWTLGNQQHNDADQQMLQEFVQHIEDPAMLDQFIDFLHQGIDAIPRGNPDRFGYLFSLGSALYARFERTSDLDDLNSAVGATAEAVHTAPSDHPDRPVVLSNLSVILLTRFEQTNDPTDLNQAIQAGHQAIQATPEDHPDRRIFLSRLSGTLRRRWAQTHDLADLNQAIQLHQLAVQSTPNGHPDRAETLTRLTHDLLTRFEYTSDLADLNRAVKAAGQAVNATTDTIHNSEMLNNLAAALNRRFDWVGDLDDLNHSIHILQQAIQAIPDGNQIQGTILYNLSYALTRRFERLGDQEDMNGSVRAAEESVQVTQDNSRRTAFIQNLGNALKNRFAHSADLNDLDHAIRALRQAVDSADDSHPSLALLLSDLGNALRIRFERTADRFERTGDLADLDEAIQILRQAVRVTSDEHAGRASYLHNLALTLQARFEVAGDFDDLNQAVQAAGEVLHIISDDHPARAKYLAHLGYALLRRFTQTDERADIDQAIRILQQAVQATPDDHPARAAHLSRVGEALLRRFQQTDDLADLDQAVQLFQDVVQAALDDDPSWAQRNLGVVLEARFERIGDPADADEAIEWFDKAALAQAAPVSLRIEAATRMGTLAASLGRWAVALGGYSTAVELLPLVAWQGARRTDRERFLAKWTGLATEAASCAIAAGRAEQALDLLEQGRGVLWSQLLETRTDLSMLHKSMPDLASRLVEVRTALDAPVESISQAVENINVTDARARSDRIIDRQIAFTREWDGLVTQARSLPGFRDFLRPRGVDNLPAVATKGPVVVVNISRWRCDALAVTAEGTRIIPLPALTAHDAVEQTNRYLLALHRYEETYLEQTARTEFELAISTTLVWLWDTIAEPVLAALGHTRTPRVGESWPHLWWCPTGPLTLLPLHAAGRHEPEPDHGSRDGGLSVMDRVVSSYAPTLRALIQARATRPPSDHPANGLLVVAMPTSPGQAPLPNIEREQELLVRLFPPGKSTIMQGPNANRQAVRNALKNHQWVHFSCHGGQDLREPSKGGVLLEDGILSISEIGADRHDHGEFAFLSACKTAVGGLTVLDEAITLVAALQHTGWRHVIGTLWSVWDTAAADITTTVYPDLFSNSTFRPHDAALALHHAVRELRDNAATQPSLWAPFMHAGP